MKLLLAVLLMLTATAVVQGQPSGAESPTGFTEGVTPAALWQLGRVGAPSVSPDGQWTVYPVTRYDAAQNTGHTDLFRVSTNGGAAVQLTQRGGHATAPVWRPDGQRIGFLWRTADGDDAFWEIRPDGTDPRPVLTLAGGVGHVQYAPDGRHLAFTLRVRLDPTLREQYPDLPHADARILDGLMYRHWDQWHDGTYRHLFLVPYDGGRTGAPVDVMPGERFDTPLMPHGGAEQITWHPAGHTIVYTSKKRHGTEAAISTDADLYAYDLRTGQTTNLTPDLPGYDLDPVFSPDGRHLAWLSMARDGYEADRKRIFLSDLRHGIQRELTAGFDQHAHHLAWADDSQQLYFTSETLGTVQLYAIDATTGTTQPLTQGVHNYSTFAVAGSALVARRESMSTPAELFRVDTATGRATPLTETNRALLDGLQMGHVKQRLVRATDGEDILTWVIYPPNFDPNQTYPALLYCQGGPQSAVSQFFSYRWNFQLMAAQGYIVVAPNRRGVPGFGQDWNEQISGDWGGQAMQDLLSAIDDVAAEPYVDAQRLGAVGASFGGYSVYWLAGHHKGRFRTFVAHAGAFNLESKYGTTEELFFANFEMGGPYWLRPKPPSYEAFSPHHFVGRWDTPMLITHGALDFRVPVGEGLQAFTALQLQGIPSRFLYFPEEGHWIQKPQNGLLWHRVFFDWLGTHLAE